MIESVGSM